MATPLVDEAIIKIIGQEFSDEFRMVRRSRLQSWEQVFGAAWCSELAQRPRQSSWKNEWFGYESTEDFGFCLVTTHRLISCMYRADRNRKRLYYGKYDRGYGSDRIRHKSLIHDSSPLTEGELASRDLFECLLKDLDKVTVRDLAYNSNGQTLGLLEFTNLHKGSTTRVLETGITVFARDTGQAIYSLLQTALSSGGRITSPTPKGPDPDAIISALERLTSLWKAKGLTDAEFEAAKKKLLGL